MLVPVDGSASGHSRPEARLRQLLEGLEAAFGQLAWWPAETPFEVMIGAVLTQNTAWVNVVRAIDNLKAAGVLDAARILEWPETTLAEAIRPSGYFNVKAGRLRAACRWWLDHALEAVTLETPALRASLIAVHGIGPETADDVLLYAFERPVFVVDAYTRRLFARFDLPHHDAPYDRLRQWVEAVLGPDVPALKQLHALIVELAKDTCRPKPRCAGCPLARICPRHGVAAKD